MKSVLLTIGLFMLFSFRGQAQLHYNDEYPIVRSVPERIQSLIYEYSDHKKEFYSVNLQSSSRIHEVVISDGINRIDFTVSNNTEVDEENVQFHINEIPSWVETIEVNNPGNIASSSSTVISYFFKTRNIEQTTDKIERAIFSITSANGKVWNKEIRMKASLPSEFGLSDNYPNPFNPTTNIRYNLPEKGTVKIEIFNVLGQKVVTLVDELQNAGSYTKTWDASNVASGMYLYRMSVSTKNGRQFVQNKKMLLIK